jgi:hypothetical protein
MMTEDIPTYETKAHKCTCKDKRCKNCEFWDSLFHKCYFPVSTYVNKSGDYRDIRRCGPEFGCISFKKTEN